MCQPVLDGLVQKYIESLRDSEDDIPRIHELIEQFCGKNKDFNDIFLDVTFGGKILEFIGFSREIQDAIEFMKEFLEEKKYYSKQV